MTAVRVNEIKVFATRTAADWWAMYRLRGPDNRFAVVTATIGGEVVDVACDDREHAEQLLELMVERGVPRTALSIVGARKAAA